jgi:hypothetical protein
LFFLPFVVHAGWVDSLVHLDLAPPKTWEQFEELCADTFAALWSDPGLVRHGRSGQRQKGVDIISKPGGRWTGLQCKRKAVWPVKTLTKTEINKEIADALTFEPKLEAFWILTTAPDDVHLQEHVRKLNEKHAAAKQFTVHLLGWREILTHATLYPRVIAKHFGIEVAQEREPLLAVWSTINGAMEVKDEELDTRCQELIHELRHYPHGRILVRQRESDDLEQQLMTYLGKTLSIAQRKQRLTILNQLAVSERREARIAQGLKLLFADPSIRYIFESLKGPGMARAIKSYVHMELGPIGVPGAPVYMRMEPKHGDYFRAAQPVTKSEQQKYFARDEDLRKKYREKVRCDSVSELTEELKSTIALPAITRRIVSELIDRQLEGWNLERMRANNILDFNQWSVLLV